MKMMNYDYAAYYYTYTIIINNSNSIYNKLRRPMEKKPAEKIIDFLLEKNNYNCGNISKNTYFVKV